MKDLLLQMMKWAISVFFFILGIYFLYLMQAGHMWALLLGMLSFGIVYWQYSSHSDEIPRAVMPLTFAVIGLGYAAALKLPALPFYPFNGGFFESWLAWTFLLGVPVIGWAFKKYS